MRLSVKCFDDADEADEANEAEQSYESVVKAVCKTVDEAIDKAVW